MKKISSLQKQLDAESQEVQRLREMTSSMDGTTQTADTSRLEDQIAALTQDRDQLKLKLDSAMAASNEMDSTKFESQIAALTQERDQLKMKLTSADQSSENVAQMGQQLRELNQMSDAQKNEIQTLRNRLANAEDAKRQAEQQLLAADSTPADPSPTLAGSTGIKRNLEFREWLSSRGSKARLAFVRWEDNRVIVVNEAGKEFRLTLNRLSLADQKYVNGKR